MQILKPDFKDLKIAMASPNDAESVANLYRKVYGSDYPCPELFTTTGMEEFLDFQRSRSATMIIHYQNEVLAAATCQINGRAVYTRGFMVDPVWQGRINAKKSFQHILLLFRKFFMGQADLFYGEARTETPKIQNIIEGIEWKPMAVLPRKDIFHGKRESEIIYAWYYQPPQPGPLILTKQASQIVAKVLQRPVDFIEILDEIPFFPPSNYFTVEKREPNGDSHLFIILPSGAELSALICYKSANSEKVKIVTNNNDDFYGLIHEYLKEIRSRKIEYAEIYIDAKEHSRQVVVELLGFRPTGFLVQWYTPEDDKPHDYIVYTKQWASLLPDCPMQCTEQGQFLKGLVNLVETDNTILRNVPIEGVSEML
jgi:hypothetical protein